MILHILQEFASYKFNPFAFSITNTMVMFNSAVNPLAYDLINQQFREDQDNDMLPLTFISNEDSCCKGTTGNRAEQRPKPSDQYVRKRFHKMKNGDEFSSVLCLPPSSKLADENQIQTA